MASLEVRERFINETVRTVHGLCRQVKAAVPEVITYNNLLMQQARVMMPTSSAAGKLSGNDYGPLHAAVYTNPARPLLFVPLYEADASLGLTWQKLCAQPSSACYWPEGHLLALRPERVISSVETALATIHELCHAQRALEQGRAGNPMADMVTDATLDEESEVHLFEARLLQALNPAIFDRALAEAIDWLEKRIGAKQRGVGCPIVAQPERASALSPLLGPVASTEQHNARHNHFTVIVYLTAFAHWLPPHEVAAARRDFLRRIYAELGML